MSDRHPRLLAPIPPGEILAQEFLVPLGISQNALARAIRVSPSRVNDIVHGRRAIAPDTAVRLAIYFGTSIDFWINLQARYDSRVAARVLRPKIAKQIRPIHAA